MSGQHVVVSTVASQLEGPKDLSSVQPGAFLSGVCIFFCPRGFSPGTPALSYSPKTRS